MVGKNNKQARWSKSANTFKRYSLKKLSVGVASVVIGTGVAWASSTTVHAAEEGTEVVTGDGEKEAPVESAVPTEAPVVGGDESSSHDAVADLVNEIRAAEEPASEAADVVEPRGANESSDNGYEPIPSDAIEGAAETSDEEKDAGGEDKINEERHTEEVSKEDKDSAEEKLDNEEFQGSFLRSAGQTRRRRPGGSTNTGGNSGSTTDTRNADNADNNEPEEPAVEILSASKLPKNPPVFYANEETGNAVNRDTGNLTVRTTGILAGTFFPKDTKFRLKDNRFTFDKGADAQKEGGNEGQWNRTTTIGWFGPSRRGVGQTNPEKLISPIISDKATPFTPHPNNHPYVVRDTGQVLFALGPSAVKGERINVPMVAEWKDPKTGRTYQWEFLQGIQVGDPQVANRRQKPDNEKDWVFVGETPAENERQSGNVKIGTRGNIAGQNFGWYGQKMGDIGQWIERKNVPKFRPTLADTAEAVEPQYQPVENGGTQSAQPSFVDQDDQSKTVNKPTGTKFSLGEGAPEGATVNADTGVVSLAQPVDQDTTVPVKVTYSDGSSDTTNVVFKPAAKKAADELTPSYKPKTITQGEQDTIDAPTFDKTATADTTESDPAPEGTTYKIGENPNLPEGVTAEVNEQTGVVTIKSSNNTPVGDFTVPVTVTYPDQSTDNVEVSVTVEKGTNTAEEVEPKYAKPADGSLKSEAPQFHAQGNESEGKDKPANTKFGKGDDAPADVSYNVDPDTGVVTLEEDIPEGGITVPVKVTYEDGSTDTTSVTFTPEAPTAPKTAEEVEPKYEKPADGSLKSEAPQFHAQGNESEGKDKPANTKFGKGDDAPADVSYNVDPDTGVVTLEEDIPEGGITVPVKVTYEDGSTDTTSVTFTPEAPTAPKTAEEVEPKYEKPADGSLKSEAPQFHAQGNESEGKDKPANTKFGKGDDAPADVSYNVDPDTGVVTLEEDIPEGGITVPVKVTYEDGSTDTTSVTFTPEAPTAPKTAEEVEPKYEKPADGSLKSEAPQFHAQGNESEGKDKPANTKFGKGDDAPADASYNVDPDTGVVTLEEDIPEGGITVPVKVTYEDGSTDTTSVTFTPEAPTAPKTAEEVEPKYEKPVDGSLKSEAPQFHAQGNESEGKDKPANTKFGKGDDAPADVSYNVDPDTGVVTLEEDIPEGGITVPVKVTYEDGSTDTTSVTFTPEAPTAPKTAEEVEPKYEKPADGSLKSEAPRFHAQGNESEGKDKPANTKFGKGDDAPADVSYNVDPDTGVVTLEEDIPEGGITVPVKVTYEDGSTDTTSVTFTPEAPTAPKTAEEVEPKYEKPVDGSLKSEAPQFHAQGNESEGKDKPANTKFGKGDDAPADVSYNVDPDTGVVTLEEDIPEGGITVPVKVTYEDGSTDTTSVTFTPEAPTAPKTAEEVEPKYEKPADGSLKSEAPRFHAQGNESEGKDKPANTKFGKGDDAPADVSYNVDPDTGVVTLEEDIPEGGITVPVKVTYEDGSTDTTSVTFTPEAPTAPKTAEEVEPKYEKPADGSLKSEAPQFHAQGNESEGKDKPANTKFGKGDDAPADVSYNVDPDTGVVTLEEDIPEGGITVPVKVTYEDGSTDTTSVTFTPEAPTAPKTAEEVEPKWEDTNAEDGKRVVVPNTGDEIPAGSTTTATITEDPNNKGKANWTVTVDDNGDVEVTPGSDAQPGDSATVTVETTYPDGTKDSSSFKVTVPTIQSFEYDPQGQDIEVPEGSELDAADGIANKDELPEGTEFEFDGPVDTSTPGKKKAKVIVAYPDGSTDTVDVTVNVTEVPTQADNHEPKGQDIEVPEGAEPDAANGIANKDELPEGTEFEFDGPVDTSTPGEKKAKVIVAYPDGSTDAVDVTVNVTDGDTPQSEIFEPQGQDIEVPEGGKPNAADGIANKDELPEGTEFEFDGPVDTSTPGKKKAKVIVAYPDGSTDTVDVTVNVTPKPTAETLEPKWNDSDAKDGGPVTVPNTGDKIPAGSTTTATITEDPNNKGKGNWTVTVGEDGSVTVTPGADAQPGDSATVTVETTYPDGSKDSSSFKVTVPAVGPTHAHGDSLVHDKPSYDLDKLGHGQTQPSRPAEDKAQTPAVDKAGLPNYVPSQSGERLPDTATGAWVLGVVGLMSTGLGSALGLKRKKEDEE
ncbi:Rib/alpha-like domain-containing protein [Dolosigranulum pigrum]|uniref:Rib/alpha-like domain-containing protein n=1 Tax=Dolosigranulum pigrum TaxID=29394 RepID=UPI001AD88A9D|nr:Rib/alpha-like domain-containing protein [Dolosigranulum pigrum]QTJ60638.1 YSIRK-type signal peptide-containing protein [Dolosigranulum pigrum]